MITSKPGIIYLLIPVVLLLLPVPLYLYGGLFQDWSPDDKLFWLNVGLALAIPLLSSLLVIFRREIELTETVLTVRIPLLKKETHLSLDQLISWGVKEIKSHRSADQEVTRLNFQKKRVTISEFEFNNYDEIVAFLESRFPDQKKSL